MVSTGNNNGITGGLAGTTLAVAMTIGAFTAIALYNVLVLNVMIWTTFKRYSGVYFYSLLISSWGIAIYSIAFLMKFFQIWTNNYISVTFITIGWYAMVTGQSFVLYSRLHLVVYDRRKIRWVLYMIIIDVFLFHVPTTVMTFGSNSPMAAIFATPYSIMEKIQVTAFSIQEFIISALYIWETRKILQARAAFQKQRTRKVMRHLILVNILMMLMDITLLGTEYANLYAIQITFKGTLYSVKLQLEFAVLNQLMALNSGSGSEDPGTHSHTTNVGTSRAFGLDTVRTKDGAVGDARDSNVPSAYTVFASATNRLPFAGIADCSGGGVTKTTRVDVHVEQLEKDEADVKRENLGDMSDVESREQTSHFKSETSSEMEFAIAGF